MGAILNGLSLSKVRPYGSGFLIFSDYGRAPIRLAAIMEIPVIYIFTHDSIGVGEDGPTHQPIEQLASLRAIPGLITLRPGDANEVAEAWRLIMELQHEPVALVLSRQAMPTLDRTKYASAAGVRQGAYVLADADGGEPEVHPDRRPAARSRWRRRLRAARRRGRRGPRREHAVLGAVRAPAGRVPRQVLPPAVTARVAVEQASTFGWERYVGSDGPGHRHDDLRRLGAAEGAAEEVRLHPRRASSRPPRLSSTRLRSRPLRRS